MEEYPGNHRAFCIRAYYRNGDSIVSAQRLYRAEFHVRNAPKDDTIRKLIRMFENTGSSVKIHHPGRPRSVRTQQAIEEVRVSVRQNPSQSVRKRGQGLSIKKSSLYTILKKDFNAETWFQPDGATCHTSNQSLAVVNQLFPEKVISRRGTINWPPRSPDLTPLDYFMWGYIEQKVYENKPPTLLQLKHNIRTEMAAISGEMCRRVVANFRFRLEECQQSEGQHLDNIILAN
ncbi:uncharacterized protein LOC123319508 [Coccinella septempunctata]|uniref:uncharacterized protein LOC123319508 n=1 Tax=Coccinella septempunctata TaxID=41139 RepID=UPI001D073C8D|nr:uncharacterized protein LOC123319508 [Coccinella septempunctata]